jgi:uncharacterized protein
MRTLNDISTNRSHPPELALHLLDALQNVYRRAERGPARGFSIAECRPVPAPFAAGDIISGDPRARSVNMFASADGELDCGVWDCTAGRFRIKYRSDELVHILEGEVTVLVGNTSRVLAAGDVAYFPAGTEAEWDIPTYVRKLWIYRTPPSRSLIARLAAKVLGALPRAGSQTPALP